MTFKEIAKLLPGRSSKVIRTRWVNKLDPNLIKGKWTDAEGKLIISFNRYYYISKILIKITYYLDTTLIHNKKNGMKFATIAKLLRRSPFAVRNRWLEVDPDLIKGEWTVDEGKLHFLILTNIYNFF